MRTLDVSLGVTFVGRLQETDAGRVVFRIADDYRRLAVRPILGQYFEDDLTRTYQGQRGQLPPYFANLIPESTLRELIEANLEVARGDDFALLEAVGGDLPGAVRVSPSADGDDAAGDQANEDDSGSSRHEPRATDRSLRFSLAGVQLKFSVLKTARRFSLPAEGRGGDWIIKLGSPQFQGVVENEFVIMRWANAAGFDVPECKIEPVESLPESLRRLASGPTVFAIRRYDRASTGRIHQEDFAQVVGNAPRHKYDYITYDQCALLVKRIVGLPGFHDFIARLVFVVASGNADAHLKNWSLVYRDGVTAELAPIYDQVFTRAWEGVDNDLALNLAGRKRFTEVDEGKFRYIAKKAQVDEDETMETVLGTLSRLVAAWPEMMALDVLPNSHVRALKEHWARVPLLRQFRLA